MTPNKRIALNIVATYGRSLYALVIGLFCGRWALMALGQQDYGLYGVICGLTSFIGFICSLMSCSVGRFYAVSVGARQTSENESAAIEECRKWFSTAVFLHTVVPMTLMAIGWPLGEYAIRHAWILVPADRMSAAIWAFRFTCLASLVGMMSVPLNAMYGAKQYIAELTIYSFITTTVNAFFLYYIVTHSGVWLAQYAAWMCFLDVAPGLIISIRAVKLFPECRFRFAYCLNRGRMVKLVSYAGWQAFGILGVTLRFHGLSILLNRRPVFGVMRNSSMSVAFSVASKSETLAGSMVGAFSPALFNAYGAGQMDRVRSLAFQTCKLGAFFTMIFAIPMLLEIDELLHLWLKEPPVYAAGLCWCVIFHQIIDRSAVGHMLAVNASGKIAKYQFFLGSVLIMTLPIAWLFIELDWGIYSVGWAMILTMCVCVLGRIYFARSIVGLPAAYWFRRVLFPLLLVGGASMVVGSLPKLIMEASFLRVVVTTLLCEAVLLPLAWFTLLNRSEHDYIVARLRKMKERFSR